MNITIIGCGWLGQQIATSLIEEGHVVRGSYRSETTKAALKRLGVAPFPLDLSTDYSQISTEITENTDVLVLAVPPINREVVTDYGIALQNIVLDFDEAKVIFMSSTGIYPQKDGLFDEDYDFDAQERLNPLYLAEKGLRAILEGRLTILRLGGLIGQQRHPIKFLQGRAMKTDGSEIINLIHAEDILRLVKVIIEKDAFGKKWNVVYPSNLIKKAYYTQLADRYELARPKYDENPGVKRNVVGTRVTDNLEFTYKFNISDYNEDLLV